MKCHFLLTTTLVLMCIIQGISGHESVKQKRYYRNRIKTERKIPGIFKQQRRVDGWMYTDFYWLTWGSIDYIDDLWDVNTFLVAKIDPDYSMFRLSFDGWLFKSWDGWSKSIVKNGDYRFTCSHDTKGRITEYLVENDCKVTFTYNANGGVHEMVWYTMEDTNSRWDDMEKMTHSYNAKNQLTEIHSAWGDPVTGEIWGESKELYSYDAQGNIVEIIYSWLDEGTNTFIPEQKDGFTYNTNNQLIESSYSEWDETTGNWGNPMFESSYDYDQNGFLALKFSSEEDSTIYSHDANGNLTEAVSFGWEIMSNVWEGEYKETQTYDGNGKLTSLIYYEWDSQNSSWEAWFKWTVSYDVNKNLSEILDENWNPVLNVYESSDKYVCIYDADNNPEKYVMYTYEETTGNWEIDEQYDITFEYDIGIKQKITKGMKNGINCVIQSGKNNLMVTVSGKPSGKDMLTVYDLQGRVITQLKPEGFQGNTLYTLHYNNSNRNVLARKVFILSIRNGKTLFTHRFIPF